MKHENEQENNRGQTISNGFEPRGGQNVVDADYEEFKKMLTEKLTEKLPAGYHIEQTSVTKLNGRELDGLYVVRDGQEYARTHYLNDLYDAWMSGMTIAELTDVILEYATAGLSEAEKLFMDFADFEKMRSYICFKLVNAGRNEEMLKEWPHIRFLDLAAVLYIFIRKDDGYYQTAVTEEMLKLWNKTLHELITETGSNTRRLNPPEVLPIEKILEKLGEKESSQDKQRKEENLNRIMTISSKSGRNGAIYMMDKNLLAECAEQYGEDIVIIPSSIHEVILTPMSLVMLQNVDLLVKEINAQVLEPGDFLSDHAYVYHREDGTITM